MFDKEAVEYVNKCLDLQRDGDVTPPKDFTGTDDEWRTLQTAWTNEYRCTLCGNSSYIGRAGGPLDGCTCSPWEGPYSDQLEQYAIVAGKRFYCGTAAEACYGDAYSRKAEERARIKTREWAAERDRADAEKAAA